MTQYLLAVHHSEDDETSSPDDMQKAYRQVDEFNKDLQASGAWVFAGGLHPPSSATVVRSQGGDVLTTDGPFAETKEQLGGFWVIQVTDLDAALSWWRRSGGRLRGCHPTQAHGSQRRLATGRSTGSGERPLAVFATHRRRCCTYVTKHQDRSDLCRTTVFG